MALRGRKNSESTTMTSVTVTQATTVVPGMPTPTPIIPFVRIDTPSGNPVPRQPSYAITFNWVDSSGDALDVTMFEFGDITVEIIGLTDEIVSQTITPTNFMGEGDEYSIEVSVPDDTNARCRITVTSDSAFHGITSGPPMNSAQRIAIFTFDTRVATMNIVGADSVCTFDFNIVDMNILNTVLMNHLGSNAGGAFNGCMECVSIAEYLYVVVQIQKHRQTVDEMDMLTDQPFVDNASQAGAALVRVNTDTCEIVTIKAYKDITTAARSLEAQGNFLFFIDGSHYAYSDHAIFRDTQDPRQLSDDWKQEIGFLYRIDHPSTSIIPLGLNWRSASTGDNPNPIEDDPDYFYGRHGALSSPIVFDGGELNLVSGFGNFDDIDQRGEFPLDRYTNWNWIRYSEEINQRISFLETNGRTPYDVLRDISVLTGSILGFDLEQFFIKPRDAISGKLLNDLALSDTFFHVTDYNRDVDIANSGMVMIGNELISYTSVDQDDDQLHGISRGQRKTDISDHAATDKVYWVDHFISIDEQTLAVPISDISINNDYYQLANNIRVKYGDGKVAPAIDKQSITLHGNHFLEIDVPLDSHQRHWAQWIADRLLERFKDIHLIIDLTLKSSPYIKSLDIMAIRIPHRMHLARACQVLEVSHQLKTLETSVKLVTL